MKFKNLTLFIFLFAPFLSQAQEDIRCGTVEVLNEQIKAHPSTLDTIKLWNSLVKNWVAQHKSETNFRGNIIIPVVIHLVYNPSVNHIVSDWQVQSQIDVMNEDLQRLNADAVKTPAEFQAAAANCNFQFCLAHRDPNGHPTTGILREITSASSWAPDLNTLETIKQTAWPKGQYLNVWVCNLTSGYLGITVFPYDTQFTDGIVVADRAFGRIGSFLSPHYALGRTLTHEFGHWIDCIHVWADDGGLCMNNGGNSDYCEDTPDQGNSTAGCPTYPHKSCSDTSDMFMNYLDYSYDSCMNVYTNDQKLRFIGAMQTYRASIYNGTGGCNLPSPYVNDLSVTDVLYPAQTVKKRVIIPVVRLANLGTNEIDNCKIYYQFLRENPNQYGDLHEFDWSGQLTSGQTVDVSLPEMRDSIGFSFFIAYAKLNEVAEPDTVNNFSSRSYYVSPDAALPPVPGHVVAKYALGSSNITFQFDTLITNGFVIQVFNILGQTMYFKQQSNILNNIDIDLGNAASGIYIVRFKNGNSYLSTKVEILNVQ